MVEEIQPNPNALSEAKKTENQPPRVCWPRPFGYLRGDLQPLGPSKILYVKSRVMIEAMGYLLEL